MPAINTKAIDLFTPDEDAILACWFGVDPPASAKAIDVAEAIERLGFGEEPGHYSLLDAAVAFIVLERAEAYLPQWASVREDEGVILARKYRDRELVPERKVILQPRNLFTINWADSGPGFSWPVSTTSPGCLVTIASWSPSQQIVQTPSAIATLHSVRLAVTRRSMTARRGSSAVIGNNSAMNGASNAGHVSSAPAWC